MHCQSACKYRLLAAVFMIRVVVTNGYQSIKMVGMNNSKGLGESRV